MGMDAPERNAESTFGDVDGIVVPLPQMASGAPRSVTDGAPTTKPQTHLDKPRVQCEWRSRRYVPPILPLEDSKVRPTCNASQAKTVENNLIM